MTGLHEVDAWRATGLPLPAELTGLIANLDAASAARDDAARTLVNLGAPMTASTGVARGMAPEAALDLAANERAEVERANEAATAARTGADLAARAAGAWVARHRSALIEVANGRLARILEEAGDLGDALGGLDDEATLLRTGTDRQVKAWRAARAIADELGLLRTAWGISYRRACASAGDHPGAERLPNGLRWFNPAHPGGVHTWAHPREVADIDVRDGRATSLAAIARWHPVGHYRFVTVAEGALLAEHPVGWELSHRRGRTVRVFLPRTTSPNEVKVSA